MKNKHVLSGAFLLLLVVTIPLSAIAVEESDFKFKTSKDLYDLCSVMDDNPNFLPAHWACRGFIEGTVQYHDGVSDKEHLKRLICYPPTATIADGKAAFISWGKNNLNNSEYMNEYPVLGVVRALSQKYPCTE